MENGPLEDVFPIEHGDIPLLSYFTRGYSYSGVPTPFVGDVQLHKVKKPNVESDPALL